MGSWCVCALPVSSWGESHHLTGQIEAAADVSSTRSVQTAPLPPDSDYGQPVSFHHTIHRPSLAKPHIRQYCHHDTGLGLHSGIYGPREDVLICPSHSMPSLSTFLQRLMLWPLHHHRDEWIQLAGRDSKAGLEAARATLGSGSLSREPQASPWGTSYLRCRPG